MPLVRINASRDRAIDVDDPGAAVRSLPKQAPVIVLIHGYKYAPDHPRRCPHSHILSLEPRKSARSVSWPGHFGFDRGDGSEGLCIAFGWNACGTLWQVHAQAAPAGKALARVIRAVSADLGMRATASAPAWRLPPSTACPRGRSAPPSFSPPPRPALPRRPRSRRRQAARPGS